MSVKIAQDMEKTILEAATKLFLDKGYASTSTTQIAKEAGCNQALVHYYFRTKDRLFNAVFAEKFIGFIEGILHVDQNEMSFEEKIQLKVETHFDMLTQNPKFPLLFAYELNTNPQRMEAIKEKLGNLPATAIGNLQSDLNEAIEAGTVRKMKAVDLLFNIVSLNLSLFIIGPVFKAFSGVTEEFYTGFVNHRKKENVTTILKSLRP